MVSINDRCKKILKLLLLNNGYTSLQTLINETNVSRRSIYYDICRINEWLEGYGVSELEIIRGKGIVISEENREKIEILMDENMQQDGYVFLPTERVKIIICYIIHSQNPVYVEQLMEYCQVSRNTIFGDLRVVTNQLNEYELGLEYEPKRGYGISGDTIRVRAIFLLYFAELGHLFESGILKFLNRNEIMHYLELLGGIEKQLKVDYVEGTLLSLAALLPIMYQGNGELVLPGLKQMEIMKTEEYQLVDKYFGDLSENEKMYLCMHLLGSRVAFVSEDAFENKENRTVYELTKALVTEFEKTACVNFENREELECSLFVHINTSMYRYHYGIQIGNPMSEDIIREYPNLFELTKVVAKYMEQMIGVPIPDGEVAYLALHFGAYLEVTKPEKDILRVLVVCVNGISTGNMLKREIQQLLPYVQITGVVAAIDVINAQEICDLIISTVQVKSIVPNIVVQPILTDGDRRYILNYKSIAKRHKNFLGDTIFETVKKYVKSEHYEELRWDILRSLCADGYETASPAAVKELGIADYLTEQKIRVTEERFMWQKSIRWAGESLVKQGSIEKRYIETIISQTLYYGTYMFLTDDIMLAHAKPEDGVNYLDVSLGVFNEPVVFPNNRKCRLIFVLAAEDQEKHLRMINDIFKIMKKKEQTDALVNIREPKEILSYLKMILKSRE